MIQSCRSLLGSAGRTVRVCDVPPSRDKRDRDRSKRKNACRCAKNELFEHDSHNKEQGIEQFDRRIQFHALFESEVRLDRKKQMRHFSPRQLAKPFAFLSHARNQFFLGQMPPTFRECECPKEKMSPHVPPKDREPQVAEAPESAFLTGAMTAVSA